MRSRALIVAAVCAATALSPASALAGGKHHKRHKHKKPAPAMYYLALGDSLARGAQPNAQGVTVATNQGYASDLYATEKKQHKKLKFQDLGCLGETTGSMMNGGVCKYKSGSQLKAATSFIKSHKVAFITLDIGANDVDSCASGTTINIPCVLAGLGSIQKDVPKIATALRKAAGRKTKIVGMTYYDPFLADYLAGAAGQSIAASSVLLSQQINGALTNAFNAQKFKVADVATAFNTYVPFSQKVAFPEGGYYYNNVPLSVATICDYTWMCAAKPKGPNIHANALGYAAIAKVFAKEL
jgi:lysophospholipase L1-like esterase